MIGRHNGLFSTFRFGGTAALCIKRNDPFQPTLEVDMANLESAISHCVPVMVRTAVDE